MAFPIFASADIEPALLKPCVQVLQYWLLCSRKTDLLKKKKTILLSVIVPAVGLKPILSHNGLPMAASDLLYSLSDITNTCYWICLFVNTFLSHQYDFQFSSICSLLSQKSKTEEETKVHYTYYMNISFL